MIAAPANANQMYADRSETPKNEIASTIANDAPALMPRMPGSASGLRVSPCMQAPASPSAPPMTRARQVRANRAMAMAWSGSAVSKRAVGETLVEPTSTESADTTSTAATRSAAAVLVRVRPAVARRTDAVSRTAGHQVPSTAWATSGRKCSMV